MDRQEIGSKDSELILKGKVKVQWGNKLIDLLNNNGELNVKKKPFVTTITSKDQLKTPGIYLLDSKFIIYYDSEHIVEIEADQNEEQSEETIKCPEFPIKDIISYKNIAHKIEINEAFFIINLKYDQVIYEEGDVLMIQVINDNRIDYVYFVVYAYDILNNICTCFIPSQYKVNIDYTKLLRLKDFPIYLYSRINGEDNTQQSDLIIGDIPYKYNDKQFGIISKQNIFHSARFDTDNTTNILPQDYPMYSKNLNDDILTKVSNPDYGNTLVTLDVLQKFAKTLYEGIKDSNKQSDIKDILYPNN